MFHGASFACSLCVAAGMVFQSMSAVAAPPSKAIPEAVMLGGIIHPATRRHAGVHAHGNTVFFDRSEGKRKR